MIMLAFEVDLSVVVVVGDDDDEVIDDGADCHGGMGAWWR